MKWEIIFIAAVVLGAGCINSQNTNQNVNQSQGEGPSDVAASSSEIIYYTSSGFQPADVTIDEGETVTWINNASSSMWVGSDRHPTHTNYAGTTTSEHCENGDSTEAAFDQCSSGDRFSFTFEKTGSWGYHNHRNPSNSGTVTVE